MIQIFKDKTGEYLVQTTCLTTETFIGELAEAISVCAAEDAGLAALGILTNAMPIAFKLSGYKADQVREQRTLVCGNASPSDQDLISTVGK